MGWFRRLFGSGKVRVKITFSDGSTAIGKVPYEGDISQMTQSYILEVVKNFCFIEHGLMAVDVEILGHD
jgi:hypothetical protein